MINLSLQPSNHVLLHEVSSLVSDTIHSLSTELLCPVSQ